MKVGSLVECVKEIHTNNSSVMKSHGYKFPVIGEIYTVRDIQQKGNNILLEEIVNQPIPWDIGIMKEAGFGVPRFRELQPPMDLSELFSQPETIIITRELTTV